jgi:hypothetical protein
MKQRPKLSLNPAIAGIVCGHKQSTTGFELCVEGLEQLLCCFGGIAGEGWEDNRVPWSWRRFCSANNSTAVRPSLIIVEAPQCAAEEMLWRVKDELQIRSSLPQS